jgi:hypothetical protein
VVSGHDHLSAGGSAHLLAQPGHGLGVKESGIGGAEFPVGGFNPDAPEIGHAGRSRGFGHRPVAVERKVRPQGRAEEKDLSDLEPVLLQDMDVGTLGDLFDFANQLRRLLPVELMVAQDIENRGLGEGQTHLPPYWVGL